MKKDYSEYQYTEYDRYRSIRENRAGIRFDLFYNTVRFYPEEKYFRIHVDPGYEYYTMQENLDAFEAEEEIRTGHSIGKASDEENEEYVQMRMDDDKKNADLIMRFSENYVIDREVADQDRSYFYSENPDAIVEPLINVYSGSYVTLNYGEGILDFIYTDFSTPLQMPLMIYGELTAAAERARAVIGEKPKEHQPEKVYNRLQEMVDEFWEYSGTFTSIKDIAYASLYSAICPPVFEEEFLIHKHLLRYQKYLSALQQEYLDLIEFCYDESLYPDALGKLQPAERFCLHRRHNNLPAFAKRTETMNFSVRSMGGDTMPYGCSKEELVSRLGAKTELTADHAALAEKFGVTPGQIAAEIQVPHFMNIQYEFRTIEDILELEFTKMLEANVRFRKCRRCGKYFIMKGNYDVNYCDRVAEGEKRSCQEIAAAEKYKSKVADNPAVHIYNRYYKRYAARVKVNQIKEADFKKWKYQAITLRDDCSAGKITADEYTRWMEDSFPNRKSKTGE